MATILVNLYGSQEAFIAEYQNMLAEKILTATDFNLEEEFKNTELMKQRFGEIKATMQTCSIMIKDIKESKRINQNICQDQVLARLSKQQNDFLQQQKITTLFLSKTFWPINYDFVKTFDLPQTTQVTFENLQKCFENLKHQRSLKWHHELGSVTLTLAFDNGNFDFKCLPIHATLISYFDDSKELNENSVISSDFLAKELGMNQELLKRKMDFWVQRGVIREIKEQKQKNPNEVVQESDVVIYFTQKNYVPSQIDDNEQFLVDELPDKVLLSQSVTTFMQSNQLQYQLSQTVLQILKQSGPKSSEKLILLIKTIYKGDSNNIITESNIKDVLKHLLNVRNAIYIIQEKSNLPD